MKTVFTISGITFYPFQLRRFAYYSMVSSAYMDRIDKIVAPQVNLLGNTEKAFTVWQN